MHEVWFNYDEVRLYISTYQSGGDREDNICTKHGTGRHMDLIGQTVRPLAIDTTHPIRLESVR